MSSHFRRSFYILIQRTLSNCDYTLALPYIGLYIQLRVGIGMLKGNSATIIYWVQTAVVPYEGVRGVYVSLYCYPKILACFIW